MSIPAVPRLCFSTLFGQVPVSLYFNRNYAKYLNWMCLASLEDIPGFNHKFNQ